MQKSADHAVIAQDDPHKAIFGCKEHSFHKFAATIDRLATGQLLAADSSCSGKHHPEPTSFTAVCISAGFTYTATSRHPKLLLSWPVGLEPGLKPETCELGGSARSHG